MLVSEAQLGLLGRYLVTNTVHDLKLKKKNMLTCTNKMMSIMRIITFCRSMYWSYLSKRSYDSISVSSIGNPWSPKSLRMLLSMLIVKMSIKIMLMIESQRFILSHAFDFMPSASFALS